jgi:hypothetical protein
MSFKVYERQCVDLYILHATARARARERESARALFLELSITGGLGAYMSTGANESRSSS